MIFNLVSGGGGKKPIIPLFTGTSNFVTSDDGQSGYIEITSSGKLTWVDNVIPASVDLFGVGGGGKGSDYGFNYEPGYGGGGGYTTTVIEATLPESIDVTIAAGGVTNSTRGGTTTIGDLLSAAGGYGGTSVGQFSMGKGGDGGSGGGGAEGYAGGSNGGNGGGSTYYGVGGIGQGKPTTDLLGRVHAGGGGGAASTVTGGAGGTSDFTAGRGGYPYGYGGSEYPNDEKSGKPGGGYGGGGAGGRGMSSVYYGGVGGQGFAMIAWGDYLALYAAQNA